MKVKSDNKFLILVVFIVIILLVIAIKVALNNKKVDVSKLSDEEVMVYLNEKMDNIVKNDLSDMGERDRMEYYVSCFVKNIENEKYEDAYEMLYEDYRKNFFPNLSKFEEYAKTKFPKFAAIEHTNIERNGDLYVLWTNFGDSLGGKESFKEIKFVIKEYDLNDFKLSFSAEF